MNKRIYPDNKSRQQAYRLRKKLAKREALIAQCHEESLQKKVAVELPSVTLELKPLSTPDSVFDREPLTERNFENVWFYLDRMYGEEGSVWRCTYCGYPSSLLHSYCRSCLMAIDESNKEKQTRILNENPHLIRWFQWKTAQLENIREKKGLGKQ